MINYNYETEFNLENELLLTDWINQVVKNHNCNIQEVNYIFVDDEYQHKLNLKFLNHDTLTDIISFDYSIGNNLQGDIYISIERVIDNAKDFKVSFLDELHRVLIHGILHYCGFKDKTDQDAKIMRSMEDEALKILSNK
ncbi:rRNA maturation RNase YbeY [Aurantibacter sp.]|uniref:rRNA maturation RNase YbeY n=1 Tax=Aurantibacter sp. TaxID=2807103 RepID=UPI0035C7A024